MSIDFAQVFIAFLVLIFSLTVHEAAHAWSANRLGDPTARLLGRVSLNPAVHVDLIGTIVFPLIALMTNLPVIGWAKPVPVNSSQLRNWRRDFMMIAAAGPVSNLLLALVASLALRAIPGSAAIMPGEDTLSVAGPLIAVLQSAVLINVLLAVFNLIPVPPLDGGNVLAGLLSGPAARAYARIRPYGFMLLYGLMFTGILSALITPPARLLLSWLL